MILKFNEAMVKPNGGYPTDWSIFSDVSQVNWYRVLERKEEGVTIPEMIVLEAVIGGEMKEFQFFAPNIDAGEQKIYIMNDSGKTIDMAK